MLKLILIYSLSKVKNMSWSSNDNNSPWGKKPSGKNNRGSNNSGGGYDDDYLKGLQDKLRNMFPKKNPASFSLIIVIALAIWSLSGFYRVGTDEQGVVTRFGEYVRTTEPGLHYHLPYPIETALKPKVTKAHILKKRLTR